MEYNLGQIELSISDEEILKNGLEKDALKSSKIESYFFKRAKEAYQHFDFSQLSKFDKFEVDKVRKLFAQDSELSSRPIVFVMYILHRNGFLDEKYFKDPNRVFDLTDNKTFLKRGLNVPEGIITQDGKLYGIGKDGHIWLFNFLNLSGVDTTDIVRYSAFNQSSEEAESTHQKTERKQHFSRLKEFESQKQETLYISDEQAVAIDNLRVCYDMETPLKDFLLKNTADLGFKPGDSPRAFKANFDTFAKNCPTEYLDRSEMFNQIRVEKERLKTKDGV